MKEINSLTSLKNCDFFFIAEAAWNYVTGAGSGSPKESTKGKDGKSLEIFIVAREERSIDKAVKSIEEFIKDEFYSEVKRLKAFYSY